MIENTELNVETNTTELEAEYNTIELSLSDLDWVGGGSLVVNFS